MSCPQCPHCEAISQLLQVTSIVLDKERTLAEIDTTLRSHGYPDEMYATPNVYFCLWALVTPVSRRDDDGDYILFRSTKIRPLNS